VTVAVIGTIAALLSITSYVPQAWRIVKTRDTEGLSTAMYVLNTCAFAMWIAYGVYLWKWPIMVPNAICFLLAGFILIMKLRSRKTASPSSMQYSHP
jgi:MtN3 and saliva related transmembrane protein